MPGATYTYTGHCHLRLLTSRPGTAYTYSGHCNLLLLTSTPTPKLGTAYYFYLCTPAAAICVQRTYTSGTSGTTWYLSCRLLALGIANCPALLHRVGTARSFYVYCHLMTLGEESVIAAATCIVYPERATSEISGIPCPVYMVSGWVISSLLATMLPPL